MYLTHNTLIKTFDNDIRHLKLEENRMESFRPKTEAYVIDTGHKRFRVLSVSSRVGEVKERVMHLRSKRPINREKFL